MVYFVQCLLMMNKKKKKLKLIKRDSFNAGNLSTIMYVYKIQLATRIRV